MFVRTIRIAFAAVLLTCAGLAGNVAPIAEVPATAGEATSAPTAYVMSSACEAAARRLAEQGVDVRILREDTELNVEAHVVKAIRRDEASGQTPAKIRLEVESRRGWQRFAAGSYVVREDQSAGPLATKLLGPQSPEGLAATGVFGDSIKEGADYPVVHLLASTPLLTARMPSGETEPPKSITFEAVNGRRAVDFSGAPTQITRWLEDGEHFLQVKEGQLCKVHARSGRTEPAYDPERLAQRLAKLDGVDAGAAKRMAEQARYRTDARFAGSLMVHNNDIYYATLNGETALRLTDSKPPEELSAFSPDGQRVAYVRDDDLYVVDVQQGKERRLTEKASATIRNGKADWVYYEEVNNRDWNAFAWSPDSQSIAFLQFDDSPVAPYVVVNPLAIQQQLETERFPLAGAANPLVRLGVVRASGGDVQWVGTDMYSPDNMLITRFGWFPDSQSVYFYVQDRTQRWLDINRFTLDSRATSTLLREQTQAWVDTPNDLRFLPDSSFLLLSERDGWRHLYHYGQDGKLLRRVTTGDWEVRSVTAVEGKEGRIQFTGTRDSHLAENLYRVQLDGTDLQRITKESGSHRTSTDAKGQLFADAWSDVRRPTQVQLCDANGQRLRMLDTNPVSSISQYRFAPVELVQIPLKDGFVLEASIIKPLDFDANKKYPVWLLTYGGPRMPTLTDAWQGGRTFEQMLAQMGIMVFRIDPRSASGKGAVSAWTAYKQLGVQELRDLEEALDWLCAKPFVDATRIGMSGHSYGGFLTAFALTHSQRFAAGIAGAPVTDWRNYDTIYTERYMSTPQENPDGYRRSSVVAAASQAHGRLLLLHGARDDNVHMVNTLQLVEGLQKADKSFEMMIYPPDRHGISGTHYRRLMVDFIQRTMLPGTTAVSSGNAGT